MACFRGNYEAAYGYLCKAMESGSDDNPYVLLGLATLSPPFARKRLLPEDY